MGLILVSSLTLAQNNERLDSKSKELESLREGITKLEAELKVLKSEESESQIIIKKIDHQKHIVDRYLKKIVKEEKNLETRIVKEESEIEIIYKKIDILRESYSKYIRWEYMYGRKSKLSLLLSSESINQAMIRMKHMEYITSHNSRVLEQLKTSLTKAENITRELKSKKERKNTLIRRKNGEIGRLNNRISEKKVYLSKLKDDTRSVETEIDEKRKAEVLIKDLINKLIAEERNRQKKIREDRLKGKEVSERESFDFAKMKKFSNLKGKMGWPVRKGKVIRKFGKNKNIELNTVTINYGIDISTRKDSPVRNVAEGVVSTIKWIPGYGSVIIVTHPDNYRTVYGHVDNIEVEEGKKLEAGEVLGKVNESLEGSIFHFEIWNDRNYQDPEIWLAKK